MLIWACLLGGCSSEPDSAAVRQSIERGFSYVDGRYLRGDHLFFLLQAAMLAKHPIQQRLAAMPMPEQIHAELEKALFNYAREPRFLPTESRVIEVVQPDKYQDYNAQPSALGTRLILDLMAYALSCTTRSPLDKARFYKTLETPQSGYFLTHQLGALEIAARSGCVDWTEGLRMRQLALQQQLIIELRANPRSLSDLNVERAAILCFSGACRSVPDAYIQRILDGQKQDGSWGEYEALRGTGGVIAPEHTTALALYTLSCRLYCGEGNTSSDLD